jgi:hypothetical protein
MVHSKYTKYLTSKTAPSRLILVVLRQLDSAYTLCVAVRSGGVAHNKTMAKLASGLHKPNQQTVVSVSTSSHHSVFDLQYVESHWWYKQCFTLFLRLCYKSCALLLVGDTDLHTDAHNHLIVYTTTISSAVHHCQVS